jgi:hypothetical protein
MQPVPGAISGIAACAALDDSADVAEEKLRSGLSEIESWLIARPLDGSFTERPDPMKSGRP